MCYLAIRTNDGSLQKLNLNGCLQFMNKNTESASIYEYSLSVIDQFTTQFPNEEELRQYLIDNNILPSWYGDLPLVIGNNPEDETTDDFEILYSNSILLFDPNLLLTVMYGNYTGFNYKFISDIAEIAKDKANSFGRISNSIYESIKKKDYSELNAFFNGRSTDNNDILTSFIKQLTDDDANYEELHKIIAIITKAISSKENNVHFRQLIKLGRRNILGQQTLDGWYYERK